MAPAKSITASGVGPELMGAGVGVSVGAAVSVAGRLVAGTAVSSAVAGNVAVGVAAGLVQATAVSKISPSKMVRRFPNFGKRRPPQVFRFGFGWLAIESAVGIIHHLRGLDTTVKLAFS